jgi:hypothetical protein
MAVEVRKGEVGRSEASDGGFGDEAWEILIVAVERRDGGGGGGSSL